MFDRVLNTSLTFHKNYNTIDISCVAFFLENTLDLTFGKITSHITLKKKKTTLWPLFMDEVQLPQG